MTMNKTTPEKKPQVARAHSRRRRSYGVPTALVAGLIAIALFFGGLLGFIVANKTNTYRAQLDQANARINELENQMAMIGFSGDSGDASQWSFDDSGVADEFGDLSGLTSSDNNSVLWGNNEMLESTGDPVVVAEFNGGTVMSNEVIEPYNDELAAQVFGFNNAGDVSGDTLTNVIQTLVADKISYMKAEEMGLTELTDEDLAAVTAEAQTYYDSQKNFYASNVDTTGMTAEEADAAIDAYLKDEMGITLDAIIEDQKSTYWTQKLYDAVVKDVTATDEEIQAAYDARLAEQKEDFDQYAEDYEFAIMSGQTIVYNLDGYRQVKHILLTFPDSDTAVQAQTLTDSIAALDPEKDLDQITELQAQLDALYTDLDAQAQQILDELNAGADFDELIAKYGQDDGMDYEPAKSRGYYVSANSTAQFSQEFIEGCMNLEQPGQVSTPVHSVSGVHIIKYIGDVTPGEVPLDQVRDVLEDEVLATKRDEYYSEQVAQWIVDADPKYYPERMQ